MISLPTNPPTPERELWACILDAETVGWVLIAIDYGFTTRHWKIYELIWVVYYGFPNDSRN